MTFVFNENGCKAIKEFHTKRLERIKKEVEFLERERDLSSELEARIAIEEALAQSRFDRAKAEIKIQEMDQYLTSSKP
jgi:hypothetical protein